MRQVKTQFPTTGKSCRIAIIGESPGDTDLRDGQPFVGESGKELTAMLSEAGIVREECLLGNVFTSNLPTVWTLKRAEADAKWLALGNRGQYPFNPLKAGAYVDPSLMGDLQRLHKELVAFDPTVIVPLGNTPLWAITGNTGINNFRGTVSVVKLVGGKRGYKVLPTYHPAMILKGWANRPIVIADLMKVKREAASELFAKPERELWIEPSLIDIDNFINMHLCKAQAFSIDIETGWGQITCVGFGTRTHSLCVPFVDTRKPSKSYWNTKEEESAAWRLVKLASRLDGSKILQNGMYDMQWLWKMGISPRGKVDDTMLLHHSMFPEMQKGLGFLGSIYTNEASWKKMRPKKRTVTKKDDE